MNKKLKLSLTILGSILLIGAVVTILCLVFIPQKNHALAISLKNLSLLQNSSQVVEVECTNDNAEIEFDIYDESIATISGNVVYAHSVGVTTLRAKATYGDESAVATAVVRVTENEKGPLVDLPNEIKLFLVDKFEDEASEAGYVSERPFTLLRECSVSVSGDAVKVTKSTIVAKKAGTSVVTFVSDDEQTTYIVTVIVEAIDPTVNILDDDIVMNPLETKLLHITISPAYFTGNAELTFECSSKIISVENGVLYAHSSGKARIDVFLNGENVGSINVTVVARAQFVLSSLTNCKVEGDVIKVKSGVKARLVVSVKEASGLTSVPEWEISYSTVETDHLMNYLEITATEPGVIRLKSSKLGIEQEFYVVIEPESAT